MSTPRTFSAPLRSVASPRRLSQAAAGIAVLVLSSACGSSSSGSAASSAASSAAGAPGALATASTSVGTILTDSAGKALYGFAGDNTGVSNCTGSCASYWPPVTLTGSAPQDPLGVTAKLGELTREDGTKQLTVDGMPVYTYVGDSVAGDTNGQGLDQSGGLWWVVATNGSWIEH